ncbi:VINC protein, partial [Odontophorus gujanensis]|nr:VINC protein [Odontophorus gujanensis]
VASAGQAFVPFGRIVAKICLDKRCSAELLCATEQTHTISSQLAMVARVKAVTAESKSSSELLVSNAQNLIQAVSRVLKATEAACIKGLRQPAPDSEEAAAAAFCTEWKKNLLWHRAKQCLHSDRDELGLRKTRERAEPTLTAMVQGRSPLSSGAPRCPRSLKGRAITGSHL